MAKYNDYEDLNEELEDIDFDDIIDVIRRCW